MTYKIIDNFLEKSLYEKISKQIKGNDIPWFKRDLDVDLEGVKNNNKNGYFTFCYYNNFKPDHPLFFEHMPLILEKLNVLSLIQIRCNLTFRDKDTIESAYHTDYNSSKAITGIYFLSTCNAQTVLKIKEKEVFIDNIENRMLLFSTNILHKAIYQTDTHKRYLINFNFLQEG
tara:strand:+ start:63 stop:581 length:519 start_codon:yes stop_codon:yes gene_type:complete